MFARDVEMFIEHCENKGLATQQLQLVVRNITQAHLIALRQKAA